ncbi:enoyl-CoA hydratase/isomerase family protein [Leucobacter sp. M11]|uniref:enoyl-CoA hydratase/isomerase family protein n=1 Tax=Leucobacter sp. M11 TaxID=2993565 RepID=UPI002D808FAE|nr:enoyl-CoA hydratase-related protein [Leucobacter sp. M11]MEB4613621.1 enoyl-CoA hydratase-related protein [Leucobacter sp. M11]
MTDQPDARPETPSTLLLDERDGVLTITVNRPEALNALSPTVIDELRAVIDGVRPRVGEGSDWSLRGIILTGGGEKAFIAGADIKQMSAMDRASADAYTARAQELTSWLEELPIPVVAAVNGFALGGGCELAMACDFVYASENARFGQPEVALGLIPGFGGTVRLQRFVGAAAARELIMTGRRIDAAEAQRLGLVSCVFPTPEALLAGAHAALAEVRAQSPLAVARSKATIRAVELLSPRAGLDAEREAFAACFDSEDMREGTTAFIEKRRPSFTGR